MLDEQESTARKEATKKKFTGIWNRLKQAVNVLASGLAAYYIVVTKGDKKTWNRSVKVMSECAVELWSGVDVGAPKNVAEVIRRIFSEEDSPT